MGLIKNVFDALAKQAAEIDRQRAEIAREQKAAAQTLPRDTAPAKERQSPTDIYVELQPKAASTTALASAVARLRELHDEDGPETLGAARALLRKATTAAKPVLAHARWMLQQDDADDRWDEVDSACDLLFETLEESLEADDVDDVDVFSPLGQLLDALEELGL